MDPELSSQRLRTRGELDEETSQIISRLFVELRDMGKTVVLATHDPELIKIADKAHSICREARNA